MGLGQGQARQIGALGRDETWAFGVRAGCFSVASPEGPLLRAPQPYAAEWASVKDKLDKLER